MPCKNGHTAKRRTSTSGCIECERDYALGNKSKFALSAKKFRENNRALTNSRSAAWRLANPDRQLRAEKNYAENNRGKIRVSAITYYRKNKVAAAACRKIYAANNKPRLAARSARRRAAKIQATPAWADATKILALYALAQSLTDATGIPHHVDHIVPLVSPKVCGLHCEANLRVMPGFDNLSKGNRYWPDMF